MKKLLLLSICILVSTSAALAQKAVTITAVSSNGVPVTNSITIPAGQAARVVTFHPRQRTQEGLPTIAAYGHVVKNGSPFELYVGDVIEGPATFVIVGWANPGVGGVGNGLLTIERWRTTKLIPIR